MKLLEFDYFDTNGDSSYYSITLKPGLYKFELWGASGSNVRGIGMGGFVSGITVLRKNTNFYIYVGQQGFYNDEGTTKRSFNGGGGGRRGFSGGGASDIRLVPGAYDAENSLESRIIVAAAGGGYDEYCSDPLCSFKNKGELSAAGGIVGGTGAVRFLTTDEDDEILLLAQGGNQTHGGIRGIGTESTTGNDYDGSFGLGGTAASSHSGGGGGSSYVSGYKDCIS